MLAHRRLFQIISMIVVFTLLFSSFSLSSVSAQGSDGLERQINPQTGKVSFIGPENGRSLSASRVLGMAIRPDNPAMALAKRFGPEFGLKNPERELTEIKTNRPGEGRLTVRYQQNYEGIPVMGGELVVNTNGNGDLYSMNGEVSPELSLSTLPAIASEQAKETALRAVAKWYQGSPEDFLVSELALWIYDESLLRASTRPVELVWRMEVTPKGIGLPVRELVLVNAQRGGISLHFNQVDTGWHSSENTKQGITGNYKNDMPALLGATWYVATTGNDANSCSSAGSPCRSINGAVGKAAAGDTIRIATGTYTGFGTEVVLINKNIVLLGGWNASFTTQPGMTTIDGQASRRGITVNLDTTATIERFIIRNGYWACCEEGGGGVYNLGNLTLNTSQITSNAAYNTGGGIYNRGFLTVNNSTISNNTRGGVANSMYNVGSGILTLNSSTISGNNGGGLINGQTATLNNSTVSGNSTLGSGGGILNGGQLTINNGTITNNIALESGEGGGIYHQRGNVSLKNTIIAHNWAWLGPDCSTDRFGPGTSINSNGYNLIGNNSFCVIVSTIGDLIGTSANPIKPRLMVLQDNGGSTFTHALRADSPAINAGNPSAPGSGDNACLAADQRGTSRPVEGRCDIGAFEGSVSGPGSPYVSTYTAYNNPAQPLPGNFLCNELNPSCTNGNNPHADAAHKYAIGTFNLYAMQHNRDSLDNDGMTIISTVNYCSGSACPYDNANWTGEQIVYGDASGWPVADDVVAHEFTHAVTQYESNLFYYYQSGAINESFSDLWGEFYDQTNGLGTDTATVKWQVGEDLTGLGAIRSMSNPPAFNDPDKMSSVHYYEGENDSGGVHSNSGINNKAVYLMVDGGTFNGKTITALGWEKTAAIYYEVNTNLLFSGADYSDLYHALQKACLNLIGQKGITAGNCTAVKDAIDAVEMNGQPASNFNTDAPYCKVGDPITAVFSDDLESGTSNWIFNNGAHTRWQVDSSFGPFAQSGAHSLYADDYPDAVTNAVARLNSLTVPNDAYLHFAHAYGFESGFNSGDPTFYHFDGGVLEYSINNGSTWLDAGSLIDHNGYKGRLFVGAGNPLSGRSAFVGDSHGYISTRLNLSSLAGKNVTFRWRMGLDEAGYDWGWWVDNIKLYTCTALPGAFNKTSPSNGSTGVSLSTTLSWSMSSFANSYQYCYDIINDNKCNRTWNTVPTTSVDVSNLGTNTTYYWQVRAVNATGTTDADNQSWSSFTTTPTLPAGWTGVETVIGTNQQGKYSLNSGQSLRENYTGVDNGPVKLSSTTANPIIGAERLIYKANGVNTSFSEMMGLPNSELDNVYWLPWYNNVNLDTQLRFANVTNTPTTVTITIGGVAQTPTNLGAGESTRISYPGIDAGPVKIESTQNIVASERIIYKVNNVNTSFSEMMALPEKQLDNIYWLPWYNNVNLDSQLRFANVTANPATVTITIGSTVMPQINLGAGESTRISYPGVDAGPVKIESTQPIVASERVIYKVNNVHTSFSEVLALPNNKLTTTYWLPWYNNLTLDTQLRIANVSANPATVTVTIGGVAQTPINLAAGESTRVSYAGIDNGPVQITSTQNIVAAERVIYKVNNVNTSFSEMMALPDSLLSTLYWFPWYNNTGLDTQLRFGVP